MGPEGTPEDGKPDRIAVYDNSLNNICEVPVECIGTAENHQTDGECP